MPTGYTSKLHDGEAQTFPEFVMSCARAFGALITMRDEPMDAEIPEQFTPSSYHVEAAEAARREETRVTQMTVAEVEAHQDEKIREAEERRQKGAQQGDHASRRVR